MSELIHAQLKTYVAITGQISFYLYPAMAIAILTIQNVATYSHMANIPRLIIAISICPCNVSIVGLEFNLEFWTYIGATD